MYRPFSFFRLPFRTVLFALLLVDAFFILLNVAASVASRDHLINAVPDILRVSGDLTLPEDFNYVKWTLIAISLGWLALRDHWLAASLWAIVFVLILLDDSMQLHENLGHLLSQDAHLPSAGLLSGDDLGEILIFCAMGAFALLLVGATFREKGSLSRKLGLRYGLVVAGLAFFGVGLDALHQAIVHLVTGTALESFVPQLAGLFEDGGEMVVGSIALALTLAGDPVAPEPASPGISSV